MNSKPLVSAIISTYNSENFFEGRLDDLIRQTIFDEIEIIIINSGSEQNEGSLIKSYLTKFKNIKYLRTEYRETIYNAWNRAIRQAKGKYITNANTDDRLRIDALEILSTALENNKTVGLVYANQYITNVPNILFESSVPSGKYIRPIYSKLKLLDGYLAGSQSMWRASIHFQENIWFNDAYEVAGDYDFACRVSEKHAMFRVNQFLGLYYKSDKMGNKEFQNIKQTIRETREIQYKYAKRYVTSMTSHQKSKLLYKLRLVTSLPRCLYSIIRIVLDKLFPDIQIPQMVLLILIKSIIHESIGNAETAVRACKPYMKSLDQNLLMLQYQNLTKQGYK